jgi:glycosyltransferase involved in cell wall biosynthesis
MISFIVPAHNEQACLGRTLEAIRESALIVGQPSETIVVDDASTDATAAIAQQHGATVIPVRHRQIAATRNSGARAARGERLFFVDADTTIHARVVALALRQMDKGAVGGAAPAWFDSNETVPLYGRFIGLVSVILSKLVGFTGGACMFCTHEAFQRTGGFNERLFWAEEIAFALALKREGRFVVLWDRVSTSGRRLRRLSGVQLLFGGVRTVFSPVKMFTQRSAVQGVWYDSNRRDDDKMPNSFAVRVSNAITLAVVLVLASGPLWNFIPHSLTPMGTVLGTVRLVIGIFLCHVGLLLWPVAIVLLLNLLRQKRWTGLFQSLALITIFSWQAWGAARGVFWTWKRIAEWLA